MGVPSRVHTLEALAVGVACVLLAAHTWWAERHAHPVFHDEHAHLFQAATFAGGRLSHPSPPSPESFEAAHVLVTPRFMAKYLPGHSAALAPFVAAGVPWLWPCLAFGMSAALLWWLLRTHGTGRVGAATGAVVFAFSGLNLVFFTSYLSTATATLLSLAAMTLVLAPRPHAPALVGVLAWAPLTRPLGGAALLLAGAAWALATRSRRTLGLHVAAGAVGLALVGAYDTATLGSPVEFPWALYARQYLPAEALGVGPANIPAPTRGLPPHLAGLAASATALRRDHAWENLPAIAARRLDVLVDYSPWPPLFLLIPLAFLRRHPAARLAAWFAAVQFGVHLLYSGHFESYAQELHAMVSLLVGAAVGNVLAAASARVPARPVHGLGAVAVALLFAWRGPPELARARTALVNVIPLLERVDGIRNGLPDGALLFVRYPDGHPFHLDFTYNEPDLARARVVVATDRGAANAALLAAMPARSPFLLDLASLSVTPLR